jgi:riboflavin kinase/FMN adenylyltransferase
MRKGYAVTIGFFDGVHRGHRFLLQQLEKLAVDNGLSAMAVTFDRHPRQVVCEGFVPSLLTTQEEKLALLSKAFGGEVVVLPFTSELSSLTAKEFMQSVLREKLNAELLLMGYNHRFGHGGGTPEEYTEWGRETGIEVCMAKALEGEKVSSSRIRNLISLGEMEKASTMLGYPYFLTGKVTSGKQIGRKIGFPTANLNCSEQKLLPACGAYAVWIELPDGTKRGGMLCIGHRPTVEPNGNISVEAHIFDFNDNLYGEQISVDFIGKLRDERYFASLEELKHQLTHDAASAREIINRSA